MIIYLGDAETLYDSFAKNSIDYIMSIESLNWIGNLEEYFKTCFLLLRNPSNDIFSSSLNLSSFKSNSDKEAGVILLADYFNSNELEKTKEIFLKYFKIIKSENITANVYHAIKLDGERRKQRLISSANFLIRPLLNKLSFDISDDLKSKRKSYYAFALQKRVDVEIDDIKLA